MAKEFKVLFAQLIQWLGGGFARPVNEMAKMQLVVGVLGRDLKGTCTHTHFDTCREQLASFSIDHKDWFGKRLDLRGR